MLNKYINMPQCLSLFCGLQNLVDHTAVSEMKIAVVIAATAVTPVR